ncbi:MAG: M48 family metalloprotease [Methylophilaceae bacterium]|uniref:M48 family metalloprotease n=1 Tax=Methylobacillus sp. MM3 TaxID=1848039 RepID=UPI0007E0BFEC|nr:M48 family metalloprotease [Methylobacillus sp. MM3]OAJ70653.1 peptidase M48 [Methylobacillus sp. MM3]
MKFVYLFLLLLCVPNALADGLPDLGDSSQLALTAQDERRIGEEIMRDVNASGDVIKDIEVVDYLQNLGYRLAANSGDAPQKFTFFVVQDPSINAFALPASIIGVHSGLIMASSSESELASVISHEIGHVTQHHIARMIAQQKQDAWQSFAAMAFALLAARSNPQLAGASMQAAQAGAIQKQLDYTREHEREADRVGLQILSQAGFDTRAMPAFFDKLMKGTRFYEGSAPAFLRTHPLTTERIADVRNRVEQLPYRQVTDSPEFNYTRAKLRAMVGNPNQAVQWFQSILNDKKYVDEAAQRYGLAVAYLRANKLESAREEVAWLRNKAPRNPMIETLAGNLLVAMGNERQAEAQFKQGLAAYPNHRGLIYGYGELLLATGQLDAAVKLITDKQQAYPDDPYFYELKSQAYTRLGKNLLRHQAQGEAYYLRYNLPAAIEQMEIALRSGDGNFYEMSGVEARLKQMRSMLAEPKR